MSETENDLSGSAAAIRTLDLDGLEVELRPMSRADRDAIVALARSLPAHDLLFLRRDISDPAAVDAWLADIDAGLVTTLLARHEGELVGYVTLHRNALAWSRHVAEIRVVVAPLLRGQGLGRELTQEGFRLAVAEGVEKIVARMTPDQKGAISVFEGLGFRAEALLADHVKDRDGNLHDLLVMSHSVAEFGQMLDAYGVADSLDG